MSSPPLLPFNNNNNYIYDDSANYSNNTTTSSHAHPMDNLKPTLLTLLLILFVTLLLSVSFCLLLRHLNRRCLRLLSSSSSSPSSATTSSVTSNRNVNRVSPDDPATSSLLDSLPIFTFSSIKRRSSSSADCAVCLSKFEEVDRLRLLPLCCHAFHVGCIDTWLQSNQTCPLCRSPISASESDLVSKALLLSTADEGTVSFRLEIGSISRRRDPVQADQRSSYSLGSFDYEVDQESEIPITWTHARSISDNKDIAAADTPVDPESLAADVASGRSWLKDYVDRLSISLSSRAMSFRGSGSFFTGSSRRSDVVMAAAGDGDLEASRVGEEISEMFRWLSGV